MDQIRQQVALARRRLWTELFLQRLVKCWFVALLAATAAVAIPRLVAVGDLPGGWDAWWLGGAVAAGLATALAWTSLRGRTTLDAAMEIDRRFDLKERVASTLSLTPDVAETEAGRALTDDAIRAVKKLHIDERFRIRLGRAAWLPAVPALLALALVGFVDNKAQSSVDAKGDVLTNEQRNNASQALRKRLVEPRKAAAAKGLKEAEELLAKVDKDVEKLAAKKDADRKQTLVKLNDLSKELADRRQKLGGDSEMRKQLAGMKGMQQGPGDKMIDAMKDGKWDAAKQELAKLQEKLASGKLDPAAQKLLEKQLAQLEKKLKDAAANRQQAMENLKKQIELAKREGKLGDAADLQQKLDQLAKQQSQMKQMEKMANQLAKAQQAMKKGDKQAAAQAMQQMQKQMEQMQQEMAEGEMLEMAMDQLELTKDAMLCKECQGMGCAECEGKSSFNFNAKFNGRPGRGMGAGRGAGARPEERGGVGFRDSQVKQKPGRGAAVITGEAEGPNFRGNVREDIQQEMASQGSEPADAQVIEQLPKSHRENAEDFFNRLREGE